MPCISTLELLAMITDDQATAGYDIVRRTMSESARRADFESLWRRTLHDGFLSGSAATLQAMKVGQNVGATASEAIWQHWTPASEGMFELVFVPDVKVYDGRFANNGWLQELPDPLTKLTWDNAVLIGVDAAERLRIKTGDMVRLGHGGAGGASSTSAAMTAVSLAESCPSVTLNVMTNWSICPGPGVNENAPVSESKVAPSGSPTAENINVVFRSGSDACTVKLSVSPSRTRLLSTAMLGRRFDVLPRKNTNRRIEVRRMLAAEKERPRVHVHRHVPVFLHERHGRLQRSDGSVGNENIQSTQL